MNTEQHKELNYLVAILEEAWHAALNAGIVAEDVELPPAPYTVGRMISSIRQLAEKLAEEGK